MRQTTHDGWGITRARTAAAGSWSVALIVLNLFDALFTLAFLQLNLAREVNPLMRWAYESSPLSFVVAKVVMVQLAVLLLGLNRHLRAAQFVEAGGAALYGAVLVHHLACVVQLHL